VSAAGGQQGEGACEGGGYRIVHAISSLKRTERRL